MATVFSVLLAVFLILFAYSWNVVKRILKFRQYDSKIPGPPTHSILGNAKMFMGKNSEELLQLFKDLASEARSKGDNIFRYRMVDKLYVLPLNGKSAAKLLESTTELDKGDEYEFPMPWLGGGVLLEGYGERWKSHRKMVTPTFHFAKLENYLEIFNEETKIFMGHLDSFAATGQTVNMFPMIKMCNLDTICRAATGIKVDAQQNPHHPYVTAVEEFNKMSVEHATSPLLQIPFFFWILGYQKKKDEYLKVLKSFTNTIISERKAAVEKGEYVIETSTKKMNFLDILLSNKDAQVLTDEDLRLEVDTFLFAGHDTTTTSFSWLIWNLAHNPEIQEKVYEEIIAVFGEDPNEDVCMAEIAKLEYTEKVVKESKRRIAPVPMMSRKLREELVMDSYTLPAGANVTIAPVILHSNPQVFSDPDAFNPERFSPEENSKRSAYDYVPFSAGLRNCVGQKFAQLNEKVLLIHLIKNFKVEPMMEFDETKPTLEIISKPSNGIPVKLIRR